MRQAEEIGLDTKTAMVALKESNMEVHQRLEQKEKKEESQRRTKAKAKGKIASNDGRSIVFYTTDQ